MTSSDGFSLEQTADASITEPVADGGLELARGHTYRMLYSKHGPRPMLCTALSDRLRSWRRAREVPGLSPAAEWYQAEPDERAPTAAVWGDPFVLFDRRAHAYRLFLSARRARGGRPDTRGCVAMATSRDMVEWRVEPPAFAPGRHGWLGGPCVLEGEGRFHLLYHTPAPNGAVWIRRAVSESCAGPFDPPKDDILFAGRDVCVRPVVFGGRDTLCFLRREALAKGPPALRLWSAPLHFDPSGAPRALLHPRVTSRSGEPQFTLDMNLESRETAVRLLPTRVQDFRLSVLFSGEVKRLGLVVRTSVTGRENNTIWVDVFARRVSIHDGVRSRALAAAPCRDPRPRRTRLTVVGDGGLLVVYVDDELKLIAPARRPSGGLGLAVEDGRAEFHEVCLYPLVPASP